MLRLVALAIATASVVDLGGTGATVTGLAGPYAAGTSDGQAFVHDGAVTTRLPGLPGLDTTGANGVNGTGHVVGYAMTPQATGMHAVRWVAGVAQDLGDLGGGISAATAINASDVIVGWSTVAGGAQHGFRWTAGRVDDLDAVLAKPAGATVVDATALDDTGRIAGDLQLQTGERVGYMSDGSSVSIVRLAPGDAVSIHGLGADGTVVGRSNDVAFRWRDGTAEALPPLPGDRCADALAVDGDDVSGWSSSCGRGRIHGVVWHHGVPTAAQLFVTPDGTTSLGSLAAIAGGRVGGFLDTPTGSHAVVVDVHPGGRRIAAADVVLTYPPQVSGPGGAVLAAVDAPADLAMASFLAARLGLPLLVTGRSRLDASLEHIQQSSTVYVVGGTAVLPRTIDAAITAAGRHPQRVAGIDRFGTSAAAVAITGGAPVAVSGYDAMTAISAVPGAAYRREAIVLTRPGQPVITRAAPFAADPLLPVVVRPGDVATAAIAATLAARAGSGLVVAGVDVDAGDAFVVEHVHVPAVVVEGKAEIEPG